ncbi:MAG: hypothetical protein GY941_01865 [Planctomycetes bacterium]|nr:hypothetical protein [Planctomycetota bacterium]
MKRIIFIFILILTAISRTSSVMAVEASTIDGLISYLEENIPLYTGISAGFSARIAGKQMQGTRREKYKVKILNRDLMIIEKESIKIAKSVGVTQATARAQTSFTEVIKLEHLSPQISLIYKTRPTVGDEAVDVVYPPHIKIKINAKPANKWKRHNHDIEYVIEMLKHTKSKPVLQFYATDSCLLLTTDEKAAEKIGKVLSQLILSCQQKGASP